MTPEQKANELIEKFWVYSAANEKGSWQNAKQCAAICVQEIIDTGMMLDSSVYVMTATSIDYWQQVLSQLNANK